MVTNQIDLEELEKKTSEEFVAQIKSSIAFVNTSDTWENKEIQFCIKEDKYTLTVVMCFGGNIEKYVFRFSTKKIRYHNIYWSDIRNFFDIPYEMKKLDAASEAV